MPAKPPRICRTPSCPGLTTQGSLCPKCKAAAGPEKRSTPWRAREQKWRNSAKWRGKNGRRQRQLRREPLCRECTAEGKTVVASDVDHIKPSRGNHEAFWHGELQSLCASHHFSKTAKESPRGGVG